MFNFPKKFIIFFILLSACGSKSNNAILKPDGFPDMAAIPNIAPEKNIFNRWQCHGQLKEITCANKEYADKYEAIFRSALSEFTDYYTFIQDSESSNCRAMPNTPKWDGTTCVAGGKQIGISYEEGLKSECIDASDDVNSVLELDETSSKLIGSLGIKIEVNPDVLNDACSHSNIVPAACNALYDVSCELAPEIPFPETNVNGNPNDKIFGTWDCFTDFDESSTCTYFTETSVRKTDSEGNEYFIPGHRETYVITPDQDGCEVDLQSELQQDFSHLLHPYFDIFALNNEWPSEEKGACKVGSNSLVTELSDYPIIDTEFCDHNESHIVTRLDLINDQQLVGKTTFWQWGYDCNSSDFGDPSMDCFLVLNTTCQKAPNAIVGPVDLEAIRESVNAQQKSFLDRFAEQLRPFRETH